MTDMTSTDVGSTDLAPVFERYDRRNRLVFAAALSASLALSAVIFTHSVTGGSGAKPAGIVWGMGIVFTPLFIAAWWTFGELIAHGRRKGAPPAGPLPTGADDARNGVRIAKAGFVFSFVLTATAMVQQALWALFIFGYAVPIGEWIARATMVAVGAVMIYFGNLYPRLPTARVPERRAAAMMKVNRVSGWVMVILGLMIVSLGVLLPLLLHPGHSL